MDGEPVDLSAVMIRSAPPLLVTEGDSGRSSTTLPADPAGRDATDRHIVGLGDLRKSNGGGLVDVRGSGVTMTDATEPMRISPDKVITGLVIFSVKSEHITFRYIYILSSKYSLHSKKKIFISIKHNGLQCRNRTFLLVAFSSNNSCFA